MRTIRLFALQILKYESLSLLDVVPETAVRKNVHWVSRTDITHTPTGETFVSHFSFAEFSSYLKQRQSSGFVWEQTNLKSFFFGKQSNKSTRIHFKTHVATRKLLVRTTRKWSFNFEIRSEFNYRSKRLRTKPIQPRHVYFYIYIYITFTVSCCNSSNLRKFVKLM